MEFFFKLQRNTNEYNITYNKTKHHYLDSTITHQYNDIQHTIKESAQHKALYQKISNLNMKNYYYLFHLLAFDLSNSYTIQSHKINSQFYISKITNNGNQRTNLGPIDKIKTKFPNINCNMQSTEVFKELQQYDYCKREKLLFYNKLQCIRLLFDFLSVSGNFFFSIQGLCDDKNIIELYYILSFMFDYCVIYNSIYVVCYNFQPVITPTELQQIIENTNTTTFTIEPKHNLKKLTTYINNNLQYNINKLQLILQNDENAFLSLFYKEVYSSYNFYDKKSLTEFIQQYNKFILLGFKKIILENNIIKTNSAINSKEGIYINKLINKYNMKSCLEIGMAFGISAFYILLSPNTHLISIDPFQDTQWKNYGIKLLKECNMSKRHKLLQLKSYVALPKLLQRHDNNSFDFIFIDGFHTFDYTLIDFFYSNLLLKINGIIVIDDALHQGVNKCIKYITTNYSSFYTKIDSPTTFAVFKKIKEDDRQWDYHSNF